MSSPIAVGSPAAVASPATQANPIAVASPAAQTRPVAVASPAAQTSTARAIAPAGTTQVSAATATSVARAGQRWANAAQAAHAARTARATLRQVAVQLRDRALPPWDRLNAASAPDVRAILAQYPLRDLISRSARYPVIVHRQRALYGAWYQFLPRSEGVEIDPMGYREPRSGTFRTAARRLDGIADMGFDVVYLPPIHPIGTTARKGANNVLQAARAIRAHRGPSAPPRGATTRSIPIWARSRTSTRSWGAPGSWAWKSPSTWPCRPPRTTPG